METALIRRLLSPYTEGVVLDEATTGRIGRYLDLILQWNARTNLTAVREPEAILQRQIGESLFAARYAPENGSLMDFGSGAGLPGIPIALLHPGLKVTLAESQGKKASFLREAARVLQLPLTIWAQRVENLPSGSLFDCVAMRAVDDSVRMLPVALERIGPSGSLLRFLGEGTPVEISGWRVSETAAVPNSKGLLQLSIRA